MAASLPLASLPVQENPKRTNKGFKVAAGEGRAPSPIRLKPVADKGGQVPTAAKDTILDVKVSSTDTDGQLFVFEQVNASPRRGVPLHVHAAQDEMLYILEGEYVCQVGEAKHQVKAGDTVFLPRQVPHAWTQLSPQGRMVVTFQPAGKMEAFFVKLAGVQTTIQPAELAQIWAEHGVKMVGPPIKLD